jgi:hypothetical protein
MAWAAVITALATLGGSVGAPSWMRVLAGAFAALGLLVTATLTWRGERLRLRPRRRASRLALEDHFAPKGRGVSSSHERGEYFTGRVEALREVVTWLQEPVGNSVRGYAVTGDPGSGKSAVLGRIVRLSDRRLRAASLVERAPRNGPEGGRY